MAGAGERVVRQVSRAADVQHLFAVDPDHEAVIVVYQEVERGHLRPLGHGERAAEKHRRVSVAHVGQHRAAVAVAVADRRAAAWPIAVVEVGFRPLKVAAGGMVVALVVTPLGPALEQRLGPCPGARHKHQRRQRKQWKSHVWWFIYPSFGSSPSRSSRQRWCRNRP